jgi:hypothetical protein
MTSDEDPTLPYYGIDDETGEQYFGPCDEKEAIETRNGHPRHAHIELRRHPVGTS